MIDIRPAYEEDINDVCSRAKSVYQGESSIALAASANIRKGPSFSLVSPDGRVGCIVGGIPIWDGVARCWAITTPLMDLDPMGYGRTVRALLRANVEHYKVHRLEMTVKVGFEQGIKFAKFLGFEAEGLLRNYGPDKSDYLIFGRLS